MLPKIDVKLMINSTACFVDGTPVASAPAQRSVAFGTVKRERAVIHHISRKWQQYFAHTQYFVCMAVLSPPPNSLDACGNYLLPVLILVLLSPLLPMHSFFHPFYPDVTCVTKDARLSLPL